MDDVDPRQPSNRAVATREPGKYPTGARLLVGSALSFVVASLLYGPQQVLTMLAFATICTVGIGLLLILAACWAVGWVVLEIWSDVATRRRAPRPT